jgi:hypothetical protein
MNREGALNTPLISCVNPQTNARRLQQSPPFLLRGRDFDRTSFASCG